MTRSGARFILAVLVASSLVACRERAGNEADPGHSARDGAWEGAAVDLVMR